MILDIPNKQDFYTTADHMVNEAWEKIANLAYDYCHHSHQNNLYRDLDLGSIGLDNYWSFARPKLISALTLVLQSVEFRLKGMIVEISPYLLIANGVKNPPKADENGDISYTSFHTLDAQDLIRVYQTFSSKKLNESFISWYKDLRVQRNKFMHTVDKKSDISAELVFKSIIYAQKELNSESPNWIRHRYNYKIEHASGGLNYDSNIEDYIFEMLQTHYELTGVLFCCSDDFSEEFFNYRKYEESYYCKQCVSIMEKNEYFDSRHLDNCIKTVQYDKEKKVYVCIFCGYEQQSISNSIFED